MLHITGELDMTAADRFAERADAAVQTLPGPVLIDLSGLTFIDAYGARVLDAVIQTLPAGRPAAVRACPGHVRQVIDLLGLSLDYSPAGSTTVPPPGIPTLVSETRRARLRAIETRLDASRTLAELADTSIRLASTIERAGLIREQSLQLLARSRRALEQATGPKQPVHPASAPAAQGR